MGELPPKPPGLRRFLNNSDSFLNKCPSPRRNLDGLASMDDLGAVGIEPQPERGTWPQFKFTLAIEGQDTGFGVAYLHLIARR